MHNGAMSLISGDGIKGDVTIERLFCSEQRKFLVDGDLSQLGDLWSSDIVGEPFQELHHSDAVFQHRRPKTRYLCGIFDGLHAFYRRLIFNNLTRDALIESIVHLIRIEQDIIFEVVLQPVANILVGSHSHPFGLEISLYLGSEFIRIYK